MHTHDHNSEADAKAELHSRSWEMELLLSAAVIFSLFQLPAVLDKSYDFVHHTVGSEGTLFFVDFSLLALYSAAYILIANFSAHLILRSFWIGLVGLDRTYPHGINIHRLSYPRFLREYVQEHIGDLNRLTMLVDRASSVIFSFTFLIVGILSFVAVVNAFVIVVSLLLNINGIVVGLVIATCAVTTFAIPTLTVLLIDKFTDRYKPEWKDSSPRFERTAKRIYHFLHIATPRFFMAPIMYVLSSNIKRWKFLVLLWTYIGAAALIGFFSATGIVQYKSAIFYPDETGSHSIEASYYENQRMEDKYSHTPMIQSDVITDKYIRLFIPYNIRNNDSLLRHSGSVQPFAKEGISWRLYDKKPSLAITSAEQEQKALECLKGFYSITLNDSALTGAEFLFYEYPKTTMKGIITYIPAEAAHKGRNMLLIRERFAARPRSWYISFWM